MLRKQYELSDIHAPLTVVEFGAHYMKLESLSWLLKDWTKVSFYYRAIESLKASAPKSLKGNGHKQCSVSMSKGRSIASLAFYLRILQSLKRGSLVWITTGPEQRVLPDLVFFAVLVLVLGPRVILSISAPQKWVNLSTAKGADKIFSALRAITIARLRFLTFETNTQRQFFANASLWRNKITSVVPTRLSDELDKAPSALHLRESEKSLAELRVGLLGGLTASRRDYGLFQNALARLPETTRNQLCLVILGRSTEEDSASVLESLRREVKVVVIDQELSQEDFAKHGSSCDVLIAPLRTNIGYGLSNGSGAFGDAIFLNRPLIVPKRCDPDEEFGKIAFYYNSPSDLVLILTQLVRVRKENSSPDFAEWNRENVLGSLLDDFGLSQ